MAVKIRLARHGAKKRPYYRVVIADSRAPRDGRLIEEVGRYNPLATPPMIKLDLEKIDTWLEHGAQPSDTVKRLIDIARDGGVVEVPQEKKLSKKAQAKAEAAAQAEAEAAAQPEAEDEAVASDEAENNEESAE